MLEEARAIYEELDDDVGLGNVLWAAGTAAIQAGEGPESEALLRASRDHFRRAGERTMEAWADHMLGASLAFQGRFAEAVEDFATSLRHFEMVGDVSGIAIALGDLSVWESNAGDPERAARLWFAGRDLGRATGVNLMEASIAAFPNIWREPTPDDLPPGRFAEIEREVASWSLDEVLAYARDSAFASAAGAGTDDHEPPRSE
jgi:hypothetical protein